MDAYPVSVNIPTTQHKIFKYHVFNQQPISILVEKKSGEVSVFATLRKEETQEAKNWKKNDYDYNSTNHFFYHYEQITIPAEDIAKAME